eukprot:TRINITY_DN8185_c0_g1_i1.p1 TRINITY_DN8185_c0_g1~~TRINITY_DN8185_c0_g1_i1.p1  ORF type:complete len:351 (-),score=60.60 TRINITY_DN8185_c0_g1_i1:25-1077(-)
MFLQQMHFSFQRVNFNQFTNIDKTKKGQFFFHARLKIIQPKIKCSEVKVGWLWDHSALQTEQKLSQLKLKPKQSLGQNFVTDEKILDAIAKSCNIRENEIIVEIGPGTGNLTKHLLQTGAKILAIEKDDVLSEGLMIQYQKNPNLIVVNDDILKVDVKKLLQENFQLENPGRVKIIANLPYNITTNCLKKLLVQSDKFSELFFMLQDEVAQRLVPDKPVGTGYRAMTIFVHQYSFPNYKFLIQKEKYYPVPKVNGALVQFTLKTPDERNNFENEKKYLQFVTLAFQQRRKSLKNSVQQMFPTNLVESVLEECGLSPMSRIQELNFEQTHQVFDILLLKQKSSQSDQLQMQ